MIRERRYSRGKNAYFNPKGQLSILDFACDTNGYIITGWDLADPYFALPVRPSQASRKWLPIEETYDTFRLGKACRNVPVGQKGDKVIYGGSTRAENWYLFGYRSVIEYYDTNILVQVLNRMSDEGLSRDNVINRIIYLCKERGLTCTIAGDLQFINITKSK